MTDRIRRRATVSGVVQGVGFRWSARERAVELGLTGWVGNLPNGQVRAEVEGTADAVEAMVDWLRTGPRGAHVDDVALEELTVEGATGNAGFEIR